MKVPGGQIEITLPDEPLELSAEQLLAWVRTSATAVAGYYGHFPVPHLALRIRAGNGAGVGRGITYPTGGGLILISGDGRREQNQKGKRQNQRQAAVHR